MVTTQVLLTPALKFEVDSYSQKTGISFSEAVRRLVDRGLSTLQINRKLNPTNDLLKIAKTAVPKNKKIPSDLASNDEYLYGQYGPKSICRF